MGRKKIEINQKMSARLIELLDDCKTTQKSIAAKAGISENQISRIRKGTAPMSHAIATLIANQYPPIRWQWLMGLDDYKTEEDKMVSEFRQFKNENDNRQTAVRILAQLAGFEIGLDIGNQNEDSLRNISNSMKKGYHIKKDGEVLGYCSLERFNLLTMDILELTEQRINSYLREISDEKEFTK